MKYALSSGIFPVLDSLVMVYTIFAPSDEAFQQLDERVKSRLESDPGYLRQVVLAIFHAIQCGSGCLKR